MANKALVNLDFHLFIRVFQVKCLSIYTPRNFIELSHSTLRLVYAVKLNATLYQML